MDVLLPEDPQEENTTTITGTAMEEGEKTSGDNLGVSHHGTSQEEKQRERKGVGDGGIKDGEVGTEVKHREGSGVGGSGKAAATASAQSGKGKPHATGGGGGRKPRTKGLVKKLQEQVIMKS
jgi:hypothetical protein